MKKILPRGDDLYSEDVFWVLLDYEVTRSQRYPSALSLLQLEMTAIAGDDFIIRSASSIFGSALNTHLRAADITANAGDQYFIILPNTDEEGGRTVCDRLISVFRNRFETRDGQSISFSLNIGLTAHSGGASLSKEKLLEETTAALNRSKIKGPNTYAAFSDLG